MQELIKQIEIKTGYSHKGSKGEWERFVKYDHANDRMNYHYFKKTKCELCGGDYMHRKHSKAFAHISCSAPLSVNKGKK
jgi:hypothetical protein